MSTIKINLLIKLLSHTELYIKVNIPDSELETFLFFFNFLRCFIISSAEERSELHLAISHFF